MKRILPNEPISTEIFLTVYGMTCSACAASIRNVIESYLGSKSTIDVNVLTGRVLIQTNQAVPHPQEIVKCIEDAGFACLINNSRVIMGEPIISESRLWFRRLVICCIFGIPEFIFCMIVMNFFPIPESHCSYYYRIQSRYNLEFLLVSPLQWTIGLIYAQKAFRNLKFRVCTMDLLVTVASFACYLTSVINVFFFRKEEWMYFEASSTLLLFVTIGKFLECYAKEKTKIQVNNLCQGIEKCITATLCLEGGDEKKIPVSSLKIGDTLVVKNGEYFPADGVIIKGDTTADESLITGESKPISKMQGSRVFAGSINGNGIVKIKVEQEYSNSTIAQTIQLVQSTSQKKPKIQNIAEYIASIFVPVVLAFSLIIFVIWISLVILGLTPSYSTAFGYAISVLTVACPCALGLAIPTAIFVGKGVAARHGILIKDEARLIDVIASKDLLFMFDKTGTLTKGRLSVQKLINFGTDLTQKQLLECVLSLEKHSDHVISEALTNYCTNQAFSFSELEVKNYAIRPGRGVEGTIEEVGHFLIGSKQFLMEHKINLSPLVIEQAHAFEELGMVNIYVSCDAQPVCYFVLSDSLKDDAIGGINKLKNLGLEINMLTGDSWAAARWISEQLSIERVYANASPSGKADLIIQKQQLSQQNRVVFIGDGVNDGPALAQADLGISIGMNSSHLAQTAASVVLLSPQVVGIYNTVTLAKKIRKTVLAGFWWAIIYNMLSLPLASGVFHYWGFRITPGISGLLMACSSVSVIANALLLCRWKPYKEIGLDDQINLIV